MISTPEPELITSRRRGLRCPHVHRNILLATRPDSSTGYVEANTNEDVVLPIVHQHHLLPCPSTVTGTTDRASSQNRALSPAGGAHVRCSSNVSTSNVKNILKGLMVWKFGSSGHHFCVRGAVRLATVGLRIP